MDCHSLMTPSYMKILIHKRGSTIHHPEMIQMPIGNPSFPLIKNESPVLKSINLLDRLISFFMIPTFPLQSSKMTIYPDEAKCYPESNALRSHLLCSHSFASHIIYISFPVRVTQIKTEFSAARSNLNLKIESAECIILSK